jgi:phosphatidylethanolamine/phosphatidyl-N-methylethanolamine N-methyltransferase
MRAPRPNGLWLHFRRFLTSPRLLASLVPSSRHLARLVAASTKLPPGTFVVEIGAGTGNITRGLLEAGIPAARVIAVEIDPELAGYLGATMPDVTVLECDVFDLPAHLPEAARNRIGAVICGIPGSLLPPEAQQRLVDVMFSLLPADTPFLAYSHRFGSPLPEAALGIEGTRLSRTFLNVPMASVWSFRRSAAAARPVKSTQAGVA